MLEHFHVYFSLLQFFNFLRAMILLKKAWFQMQTVIFKVFQSFCWVIVIILDLKNEIMCLIWYWTYHTIRKIKVSLNAIAHMPKIGTELISIFQTCLCTYIASKWCIVLQLLLHDTWTCLGFVLLELLSGLSNAPT